jgi:putative DNA-invertase from lambdoid prophage Rac
MRTALYARVSTTDQSCEMQLRELRDYAERRAGKSPKSMSIPAGAGREPADPNFHRLMRDARARRFDAVLIWKLDRWGRSVAVASVRSRNWCRSA